MPGKLSTYKISATCHSLLILLAIFCYPVNAHEYTTKNAGKQISTNLQFFFEETLQGCTIRTILDVTRSYSEDIYVTLSRMQRSFKTLLVDRFRVFSEPMLASTKYGLVARYNWYRPAEWLLKKYSSCSSHLYITENASDLLNAIRYHFVDYDFRKEAPDYVIFWDLHNSQSHYQKLFSHQEFYRTFMDYRMVIRMDLPSSMFDISLACVMCSLTFPEGILSAQVRPATLPNIHQIWKNIHKNNFGVELPCSQCVSQKEYKSVKYRKDSFPRLVAKLTNVTLTFPYSDKYSCVGYMTLNNYLTGLNVALMFLDPKYPRMTMSPSLLITFQYKMFTVVYKNLLVTPGLGEFFVPFTTLAWYSITLSALFVLMITERVGIDIRFSSLLLSIFGPFTDQWILSFKPSLNRCFFLWGVLCYSLTVLYGGELASSLAVFKPPKYPTNMETLMDLNTRLISLRASAEGGDYQSHLVHILESQQFRWGEAKGINGKLLGQHRLATVIRQMKFGYCQPPMRILNHTNEKTPFRCKHKPYITKPDKPMTYIDVRENHILERYVFQDSPLYWVSSTSQLPELQDRFTLILSRNYFAKLVLPLASSWVASGLDTVWEKIETNLFASWQYSGNETIFEADMNGESTRVIDFTPLSLQTQIAVITLWTIGLAVASTAFLGEWLPRACMHSRASITKLLKLCRTDKSRVDNYETDHPKEPVRPTRSVKNKFRAYAHKAVEQSNKKGRNKARKLKPEIGNAIPVIMVQQIEESSTIL